MASVNLQKASVNKIDVRRGVAQLEQAHNKLVQDLTYLLKNLDDKNFSAAFLARLEGGGS